MLVDKEDGVCRTCGGQLEIIDVDDARLTVQCLEESCLDSYRLEPDALNDGGITYWPQAMAEKGEEGFE